MSRNASLGQALPESSFLLPVGPSRIFRSALSRWTLLLTAFLLLAGSTYAQVNGRVSGLVVDSTGSAIPNAKVSLSLPGSSEAVISTVSSAQGFFTFGAVRPAQYDLTVEAAGFTRLVQRNLQVNPIQDIDLGQLKLDVSSTSDTVEVVANAQQIQTTTAELSTTVSRQQIESLPVLNRQVSTLFTTQAGVSNARGATVINGIRTSGANVTIDGVNIQDNFIRTNALDFLPFRPTIDQISEMTIAIQNAESTVGGGSSQLSLSTRSGTNTFSGSAYWYNRNSYFGANDWFNNRLGQNAAGNDVAPRPFINQNQPGGSFGGPILKNKLLFFVNYEAFRLRQQSSQLRTVLTPEARSGLFRYRTGGETRSANVLALRNASINPVMNSEILSLLPLPNSTEVGDGLNTSGYRFNAAANQDRDQLVNRMDYYITDRHSLSTTVNWTKEKNQRPDVTNQFYGTIPAANDEGANTLFSLTLRSTISPTITNELRGGFAFSQPRFTREVDTPARLLTLPLVTSPLSTFLPQGRDTNTYVWQDNVNWVKGSHQISFGVQGQSVYASPFNDGGIVPSYAVGFAAGNPTALVLGQLPGISSADLTAANNLAALLSGVVASGTQTFNVTSASSGFVPGATNLRTFKYDTITGYFQDKWRVNRSLTLNLGLRYEYWTRMDEVNGLILQPVSVNNNSIQTLLNPNMTLDFAGKEFGRPLYRADLNNFAPNLGLAWSPFADGKTVFRAGYSLSYINDDTITAIRNSAITAEGLQTSVTLNNLVTTVNSLPSINTPTLQVPRTLAQNYALNPGTAVSVPDPNLQTPYVQQWSAGVQRELWGNIIDVRYVGNRGTALLRGLDFNQVDIISNGFLEDFNRARNNAFLAQGAGLGFNANYNPNIAGSQQLTVFPRLGGGGLLTNGTVANLIQTGEAAELASIYQTNALNGTVNFFRNPNGLGMNQITNVGWSTYHALQIDVRRRLGSLNYQVNYTYSKNLGNGAGNDQNRFEPYLDLNNDRPEVARTPFDLRHAIKANYVWQLPFGKGQRWSGNRITNAVLGGWAVGGLVTIQSGFPFSLVSGLGTLNRSVRSGLNTVNTNLTGSELREQFGLRYDGRGVLFVNPNLLDANRRGASPAGTPQFANQAFFLPTPGTIGSLQRRYLDGPWGYQWDASLLKKFNITERQSIEIGADAFNLLNNPIFFIGESQNVTSVNFGRITSTDNSARIFQFRVYYRF